MRLTPTVIILFRFIKHHLHKTRLKSPLLIENYPRLKLIFEHAFGNFERTLGGSLVGLRILLRSKDSYKSAVKWIDYCVLFVCYTIF